VEIIDFHIVRILWRNDSGSFHRINFIEHHLKVIQLTERRLTQSLFHRKVIWPKQNFRKMSFDQKYFHKKCHLTEKKLDWGSFDRNFIWSKSHLTESFLVADIWPERHFTVPKVHFTKRSLYRKLFSRYNFIVCIRIV
jgi:hypothetical protein